MKSLSLRQTKEWMVIHGVNLNWDTRTIMNYISENEWFDADEIFHVRFDFVRLIASKR